MKASNCFVVMALCMAFAEARPVQARDDHAPEVSVAAEGRTHLATMIGGVNITADLLTRVQPRAARTKPGVTACTGSRIPCSLVDDVRIRVGRTRIPVPPSIVVRLADVDRADLAARGGGKFELVLRCGDASEAYTAHIMFDRRRISQLDIVADEAGMLSERTVYNDLSHAFDR
jgi:hypothetical protein